MIEQQQRAALNIVSVSQEREAEAQGTGETEKSGENILHFEEEYGNFRTGENLVEEEAEKIVEEEEPKESEENKNENQLQEGEESFVEEKEIEEKEVEDQKIINQAESVHERSEVEIENSVASHEDNEVSSAGESDLADDEISESGADLM